MTNSGSAPKSVAVVITSTRAVRVGPDVSDFVQTVLDSEAKATNTTLTTVDVAKFNLPVYNEAIAPASIAPGGPQFAQETSRAWAAEMKRYDGYIFVVNEYNFGMSGATKNAIDYLYHGFREKPVAIVSYGIQGGKTSSEQVKTVLSGMGLKVAETRPHLAFKGGAGPDLMLAMAQGKLGEDSRNEWAKTENNVILKAFSELNDELRKPEFMEAPHPEPIA